jgi:hypothetical protein
MWLISRETAIHGHCVCLGSKTNLWFITDTAPSLDIATKCFSSMWGLWMTRHLADVGVTWMTIRWDISVCGIYLGPIEFLELCVHQNLGIDRSGQSWPKVRPACGCCCCCRKTLLAADSITGINCSGMDWSTIHPTCWARNCGCCTEAQKQAAKKLRGGLQSIINEFTCVPQQAGHGKLSHQNGRSNWCLMWKY